MTSDLSAKKPPAKTMPTRTSNSAVTSLVLGLASLGLSCFAGVPAVIFGLMAMRARNVVAKPVVPLRPLAPAWKLPHLIQTGRVPRLGDQFGLGQNRVGKDCCERQAGGSAKHRPASDTRIRWSRSRADRELGGWRNNIVS